MNESFPTAGRIMSAEAPADAVAVDAGPVDPESTSSAHHCLLIGAGQAHLEFLRQWERRPIPNCELTLLTAFDRAIDRHRVPAGIANPSSAGRCLIDLDRWSRQLGIRLMVDRATALDPATQTVSCAHHPALAYQRVSLNIGSVPCAAQLWQMHRSVLGIKPLLTLPERIERRLQDWQTQQREQGFIEPLQLCVVGGGVSGIELALCLSARLQSSKISAQFSLIDGSPVFAPMLSQHLSDRLRRLLVERNITLLRSRRIVGCDDEGPPELIFDDGERVRSDLTLWAAGHQPPPVCQRFDLAKTETGFLKARSTLQSVSHDNIWIVGGIGDFPGPSRLNSEVQAQRQGRLLFENWRKGLQGKPLQSLPHAAANSPILDCGDQTSLTERWGLVIRSRLLWQWRSRRGVRHDIP